ncbi:hypothetical protein BT93_L3754 [Corymbia citriodora subsp. variegata]|uniref:S-protein homolog n=1 Tax=Corymbia citriodora subsp. variegata TaxID=360336 RepID=A0A8T0CYW2_CORYI|nr:hypothetical protein BT93_L3754 [Corymbia citriodora subsp. variegata]
MMMMKKSAILVFICSLFATSCLGSIWRKTNVKINNNLPAGTTLTVHCKSKNDDLGTRHVKGSWGFSFTTHVFGVTLFYCSFKWPGQFHWFDIYVQNRDKEECHNCVWEILPNGPCRLNRETGRFDACYPWNPPSQLRGKPLI